jgi:peroxiredoxin
LQLKTYISKFRIPLTIILLAGGLAWIWFSRPSLDLITPPSIEAAQIGFKAPHFKLTSLDSQEINISDLKGTPVILNFWASWCPPCKAEMPAFQQAFEEYSGSTIQIIAVNATNQDSLVDVARFVEEHDLSFPIALDKDGSASRDYSVHSLPTTYFIDKNGVIKDIIIGGPIPLSLLRIQANQLITE